MKTHFSLFTQIQSYYQALLDELQTAQTTISIVFLTFDDGVWAQKIAQVLCERATAGVQVRLMVDEIGLLTDEPRHVLRNHALLNSMRRAGAEVKLFRPAGSILKQMNRMHCKFCAIDQRVVLLGGSNIGDYYLDWSDTNLRMEGQLGNVFHTVYDHLCQYSQNGAGAAPAAEIDLDNLWANDVRLRLTIPGQHTGIRQGLLKLIRSARQSIYIRTWYFLPDEEILQALCDKAQSGVAVNILLSHHTRVPLVDQANYLHAHRLASAGGMIYRYTGRYMHAKVAWNERGEILLGSANLDPRSMNGNFESCIAVQDAPLALALQRTFQHDLGESFIQTPAVHSRRSMSEKLFSHACNMVGAWL